VQKQAHKTFIFRGLYFYFDSRQFHFKGFDWFRNLPQIEKPPKRFFCLSRSNAGGEVYATAGVTPGSSSHLDKRLFQAPKSLSITYTGLSYPRDLMPNRITAKYTAVAA